MEKTIKINPDWFKISKQKKPKEKKKKYTLKAKQIRKELLKKIQNHQSKTTNEKTKLNLKSEFEQSFNFLNTVSKEKQNIIKKTNNLKKDPPYGILKGGKKPLYRDYIKTMKNTSSLEKKTNQKIKILDEPIKQEPIKQEPIKQNIERQKKLRKIKKKIKKKAFHIGKSLKKRNIGVLIKNRTIKKRIEKMKENNKNKKINEIKKFLRERGLIKGGSTAPENIVRTTFENAKSAGHVFNSTRDILLHNHYTNVLT